MLQKKERKSTLFLCSSILELVKTMFLLLLCMYASYQKQSDEYITEII